jgi:uncharacterized RDD family membrane protein YckC
LTVTFIPESASPTARVPAEWWPRFGAWCLDGLIATAISIVVIIPFGASADSNGDSSGIWALIAVVLCTAYYWLTMCRRGERNGQTLGKQAVGVRVIRTDGKPIGPGTVLLREVLLKFIVGWMTVIGWLIDGLWPLVDGQHRALHDLAAGTQVFSDRPRLTKPAPIRAGPRRSVSPDIERYVTSARKAEGRIREAIEQAELPYAEVAGEVDSLLVVMERSTHRAQLLHDALGDTPVASVEARLNELAGTDRRELIEALEQQLDVQRRMQSQLDRFKDEMERLVVELETIRGSLLNVSSSAYADNQQRMADRVRGLRDEMSAVATGMSAGFD